MPSALKKPRQSDYKVYRKDRETRIAIQIVIKKNKVRGITLLFQDILSSHSNLNNVVIEKDQTCTSAQQDRDSRNRCQYINPCMCLFF